MVDIIHARDDQSASVSNPARVDRAVGSAATGRRPQDAPPRSDVGTIILHWSTAIALVVCLLTGLRMAIFGYVAPGFARSLSPILPQGEMWTWHFVSAFTLFFSASAYLLYVYRAGLTPRNALK